MWGSILTSIGLISVTLGALSGFALLLAVDSPEILRKVGIVDPKRIRQLHLDWIIMGVVMGFVGVAVPNLPLWAAGLTGIGGIVNPLTFIPMALSPRVAGSLPFQVVSMLSFLSLCTGLIGACVTHIVML